MAESSEAENLTKSSIDIKKIRFDWLDEFRGVVILLFIIQTVAWATVNELDYPVIAPHLNHGYKYYQVDGWPPIITIVDAGKEIFIFLVGYMAAYSVIKMSANGKSIKEIYKRIIKRLVAILLLNVLHMAGSGNLDKPDKLIYNSTLGTIAWAGLAAALITLYVKNADYRFYAGLGVFGLHLILDLGLHLDDSILELVGNIGIALVATAYTGWMLKGDGKVDESHFTDRVLPVSLGMFVLMYVIEFFQPADHHGATVALDAIAIGVSGIAIYLFYKMDQDGYKVKFLIPFGRNLLLIFILEMVIIELIYMDMFMLDFLKNNPGAFNYFIFAGIIPILIMYLIAVLLQKKGWTIRV